ncbi:MAG: class I SAM-dependent methyltransferase [Dehalococcoidaceae bacterium]|nr:class I SAM-dependent methyltransferase [Dehalococcoidaceae bacterium]
MNRIEKWMVNRSSTGKSGIRLAQRLLSQAETGPGKDILDIGCGRGVITRYVAREYAGRVVGIDTDGKEIEIARRSDCQGNPQFLEADARRLPFEDRSMDVVLAFGVLHHIGDWHNAVIQIGRVLRVGGRLIAAELLYPEWITGIDEKSSFKFGIYSLDINKLTRLLQDEGFITLHQHSKKRVLWQDWEGIFEKKYEKAWSRY